MKNKPERKFNGNALSEHRINSGYTQDDVARLLKCDTSSVSLWEAGNMPSPKNLKKIADLFKIKTTDLILAQKFIKI